MEKEREGERNGPPIVADISVLPEGCISDIFSLTSPKDACRVCAVSHIFRAAAEFDLSGRGSCRPIIKPSLLDHHHRIS